MRWLFRRGLRVLLYHRVSSRERGPLTVSTDQLAEQLRWLRENRFQFVTLSAVAAAVREERTLPPDAVLLTFDDAYRDTFELAWPILREFEAPAAIFVPTAFIGATSSWDSDAAPLMDLEQLRTIAAGGIELALHSHGHRNFRTLDEEAIAADMGECVQAFARHRLPHVPALAYPYGARPRERAARHRMQARLGEAGIPLAFRIGNRINSLPLRDPYEVNRLDIRGDRDLASFRRKVTWGRWW